MLLKNGDIFSHWSFSETKLCCSNTHTHRLLVILTAFCVHGPRPWNSLPEELRA